MPTELLHPLSIGPDGSFAASSDPDKQIRQHVRALIGTEPGERVVLVDYGVPTQEVVFDPDNEIVAETLARRTEAAFAAFEPGVAIRSVRPIQHPQGSGVAEVAVDYVRRDSGSTSSSFSRSVNTATVNVGGRVSEVIRG